MDEFHWVSVAVQQIDKLLMHPVVSKRLTKEETKAFVSARERLISSL